MEPDLDGFRAARERKRARFAEPILLLGTPVSIWPSGTPLDPETGMPYDPTAVPTSSGQASALIDAEFTWRSSSDPSDPSAMGVLDTAHPMLIAASAAASALTGMTHFQARDRRFEITATHFDGVVGIDRLLIYGAEL